MPGEHFNTVDVVPGPSHSWLFIQDLMPQVSNLHIHWCYFSSINPEGQGLHIWNCGLYDERNCGLVTFHGLENGIPWNPQIYTCYGYRRNNVAIVERNEFLTKWHQVKVQATEKIYKLPLSVEHLLTVVSATFFVNTVLYIASLAHENMASEVVTLTLTQSLHCHG